MEPFFAPLIVRSYYSLLQGTSSPAKLCRHASKLGYTHLALTDRNNLYGLWPFLQACRQEKIIPLIGAEITDPGSRNTAVCLAKNETGYANLCRIITNRHCESDFQLPEGIGCHGKGLIILSSNIDMLLSWKNASLEVAANLGRKPTAASRILYQQTRQHNIPAVATPDSMLSQARDYSLHLLLRAISGRTTLSRQSPGELISSNCYLHSPSYYHHIFSHWTDCIESTMNIAHKCQFHGPNFGITLPPYQNAEGLSVHQTLTRAADKGARHRYGNRLPNAVVSRLEHELRIIAQMGFSSYFLVVRDIVHNHTRTSARPKLICGRGSGAASLVAYCLAITNVCPVRHNLYFERFLNPGRKDPPDIDIDFAWDERDEILAAVLEKNKGHAAMVSSHILFQPRMAIRETARAYGLPSEEISTVTKRIGWLWQQKEGLLEQLGQLPSLRGHDLNGQWPEILSLAKLLIGLPRCISVHPGGVIITPKPISSYAPVEIAVKGVPIIQWDKDSAEDAGLVKIDLLGNRSLGVIRDAITNLENNGHQLNAKTWQPEEDSATQKTIAAGGTMGCFYIESPAMRLLQQKADCGDFEQLVLQSSIIRPAANEFIREYVRRLHGGSWKPLHPLISDILDETFGLMVYQEDVSRVAVKVGGFSHSSADRLRKVLSKKDRELRLRDYRKKFFSGASRHGLQNEEIEPIWQMMMSFDGYSFCKPHSASYAKVSFQAAFLKTHFPAEFMAAVISNQGGYYSTFAYVSEAKRLGLRILQPDVQKSGIRWKGWNKTVQTGLMAIKGVSRKTMERITVKRNTLPYHDINDFLNRVHPDEDEAGALIHAGALDTFQQEINRSILLWRAAAYYHRKTSAVAAPLFKNCSKQPPPALQPPGKIECLRREYEVLGFLCAHHPLTLCGSRLQKYHRIRTVDIRFCIGKKIWFAGWLITGKLVRTKSNEPMEFLTFEDETGLVETTFFPRTYQQYAYLLRAGFPFWLYGLVEEDFGAVTLTVERVEEL
jgi:error-prone DNA polymerase